MIATPIIVIAAYVVVGLVLFAFVGAVSVLIGIEIIHKIGSMDRDDWIVLCITVSLLLAILVIILYHDYGWALTFKLDFWS